jgi:hypothetical protein
MRGVLVLGGLLLCTAPALGYSAAPPHSFAKPTANGKFVLVMLHDWERPAEKGLNAKYGRSGLYPIDDPTKPVWTCDWRADWERNVFASDDGTFAVRVPDHDPGLRRWVLSYQKSIPEKPAGWEDGPVLFVYKDGKPSRTITLREAFGTSRFTDRDCFMGPIVAIESFADDRAVITTEADERKRTAAVAFRTGEVNAGGGSGGRLSGESGSASGRNWVRVLLVGLTVVTACAGAFAVLLFRTARKGA